MEHLAHRELVERRPLQAPRMADLVANELRRRIVRGELREGDALPAEMDLMSQLSVSRSTLREAYRMLETEKLIYVVRGARGGARVKRPDLAVAARYTALLLQLRATTLEDVHETRRILEPPAVHMLANRPAKEAKRAVAALRSAVAWEESVVGQPLQTAVAAARFHELIMELSGNVTLSVMTGMLHEIVESAYKSAIGAAHSPEESADRLRRSIETHRKVIDLIEAGNAESAETFWRTNLIATGQYLFSRISAKTVVDLLQERVADVREERPPKMAQIVAAELRRQIVRGEFVAGQLLPPEAELLSTFGVSRPTMREAYRILASEGLLRMRPGNRGGALVQTPDVRAASRYAALLLKVKQCTLADALTARAITEINAVRRLAEHANPDGIERIALAIETQRHTVGDALGFAASAGRVHQVIVGEAGLTTLAVLNDMLHDIIDAHNVAANLSPTRSADELRALYELSVRTHEKLLDAVVAKDPDRAERHWRRHLLAADDALLGERRDGLIDLLG